MFTGAPKAAYFKALIDKIRKRIADWKCKNLSKGGKIVLLQAVLCYIPIYLLSVIKPPTSVLRRIESIFANFLWGATEEGHKHHWISWQSLCSTLEEGGIGISSLAEVCAAARLKLLWMLHTKHNLWTNYFKCRYFKEASVSQVHLSRASSSQWKSLYNYRDLFIASSRWIVGQGNLSFWYDNWTGQGRLWDLLNEDERNGIENDDLMLNEVLSCEGNWNDSAIALNLPANIKDILLALPIRLQEQQDKLIWIHSNDGDFTTSSAKIFIKRSRHHSFPFEKLWHKLIPKKISFFLRCALVNRIPTDSEVQKMGICLTSACNCCEERQCETPDHILLHSTDSVELF